MSDLRDTIARALRPFFSGADVAYGEHVEAADAVIATLGLYEETYEGSHRYGETPSIYRRYVTPWTEKD